MSFIATGSVPDEELYRFGHKWTELIAGFSYARHHLATPLPPRSPPTAPASTLQKPPWPGPFLRWLPIAHVADLLLQRKLLPLLRAS